MLPPTSEDESPTNHLVWVRARMLVDNELLDTIRQGFTFIAAGFGSFSLFEGVTVGEAHASTLPRTFALIITAIGVIVILLGLRHAARMTAWVNADAFGDDAAPPLPDEQRLVYLGIAAVIIGVVSFVALLLLP